MATSLDDAKYRAAAIVVNAIVETIDECGTEGAPLGIMYSALMGTISYNSFVTCINHLQTAKLIEVKHNVAYRVRGI